jgi:general secretion pathway protein I
MKNMPSTQKGFTLLEVIVALTIVAVTLGTVLSLLTGSKRLAFKAAEDIGKTIFLRSAFNAAQLLEEPDYPEFPKLYKKTLTLKIGDVLEPPDRQTREMMLGLETYTFVDEEKGSEFTMVRWKKLDSAQ